MANSDSASQNVRFNLDSQQLEFALGLDWFGIAAPSATWGSITGTLSNQTDLQTALDSKTAVSKFAGPLTLSDHETSDAIFLAPVQGQYRLSIIIISNFVSSNTGTEVYTVDWTDAVVATPVTAALGSIDLSQVGTMIQATVNFTLPEAGLISLTSTGGTFSGGNLKMTYTVELIATF